ncbi:MAG: 2-succinyl-5-enolpyruvyl-6-hydroxy-3-cyclohexene-1-carboxylic-acid synthase [Myxococcales bacterium]|nr:2-succinyl-5-enolpyruvyl-6-hydroxy-3-cyclohexene-1-carboxylic-acid synthase [Myxococcales bacterium]
MSEGGEGIHLVWARRVAAALADCGARHVVLSPGSRSTPLALAIAEEERLSLSVVIDERAAGFVALGQARVTGLPSVLVCTSGSAVAHYHPAVIEADAAGVPLLVLSADRPLELQSTAASQTIDQVKLFGSHVRRYVDLGVPDEPAMASLPRMVASAHLAALGPRPGPVHVNARFRKPLEPVGEGRAEDGGRRAPAIFLPRLQASDDAVMELASRVRAAKRVVVAAGPAWGTAEPARARAERLRAAARVFAGAADAVVLAEVTSGLAGTGSDEEPSALGALGPMVDCLAPADLLVQIGRPPVASRFGAYASRAGARVVVVDGEAADPDASADVWLVGDAADLLGRAAARLASLGPGDGAQGRRAFADSARGAHARLAAAVLREIGGGELTEPSLAHDLVSRLPARAFFLPGNSSPVRDACAFGSFAMKDITVIHQRGAAGIDGLFAGLAGVRHAAPAGSPVVALVGDVSALHDVGSLAVLASAPGPCVCVVVDNGGGRIFEELPVARTKAGQAHLERLFLTPPPSGAVGAFASALGITFGRVDSRRAFAAAFEAALASGAPAIIEAAVPTEASRATRARLCAAFEAGRE